MLFTSPILLAIAIAQAAPQDDPHLLAQVQDRCMTTHAVQMTRTDATDEAIYAHATQSCASLSDRLLAAIKATMTPTDATALTEQLQSTARPRFMALLTRIRSDRAAREAGKP